MYLRMLEAFKDERKSIAAWSYNTIVAVLGGLSAIGTFISGIVQGWFVMTTIAAGGITAIIVVLLVWLKKRFIPSGEIAALSETLRLGIHLDQIIKQSSELRLLIEYLNKNPKDELASGLAEDAATILEDSIKIIEEIREQLQQKNKWSEALRELHINEDTVKRRIDLGNSLLTKYRCRTLSS